MTPKIYTQLPGDAGIYQTIYMMKDLVNKSFTHPWIRERAASVVKGCNRSTECEEKSLERFVRNTVQYISDPHNVEALHDPVTFFEHRLRNNKSVFGDCDDMSVYLSSLLKAIGHSPRFRILARSGNSFHHVHVVCDNLHLDPTMLSVSFPIVANRAIQFNI